MKSQQFGIIDDK